MFYTLLITINIVIILYLCYAIARVVLELANEEQNANKMKCNCKTSKVVPNQKSAKEAYNSFSTSLNRLIRNHPESLFTFHIMNHLQPIEKVINCYLDSQLAANNNIINRN
jgi:hypothetical protein